LAQKGSGESEQNKKNWEQELVFIRNKK